MKLSKTILAATIITFLGLMIGFAFWTHPLADDYILSLHFRSEGFWGLQKWIFQNNTGRYTSSFLGALFASSDFLYNYYYLPVMLLIMGTLFAFYLLLLELHDIFDFCISTKRKKAALLHSLILWICFLITLPEKSTAFYWFSAAITYTTSIILLVVYIAFLLQLTKSHVAKTRKIINQIATLIILILLLGTNEVMAITVFITTVCVFFKLKLSYLRNNKTWLALIGLVTIIGIIVLLGGPGIHNRTNSSAMILLKHIFPGMFYALWWLLAGIWYILKAPISWAVFVSLIMLGNRFGINQFYDRLFKKTSIKQLSLILFIVNYLPLVPIMIASNGSFPLRSLNVLSFINLISFCILSFKIGQYIRHYTDGQPMTVLGRNSLININKYKYHIFILAIVCSPLTFQCMQTLLAGYSYHQAYSQQTKLLKSANANGTKQVEIKSISQIRQEIVGNAAPNSLILKRSIIRNLALQPPSLLFFETNDPDKSIKYKWKYYGVNDVHIVKQED